jgi:hypothetical protein
MQSDGPEVRQISFWADGGIFWNFDGDFVALVLVRECFDVGQWSGNTALCVPLIVTELGALGFFLQRFTFHVLLLTSSLDLFHPFHLADFF